VKEHQSSRPCLLPLQHCIGIHAVAKDIFTKTAHHHTRICLIQTVNSSLVISESGPVPPPFVLMFVEWVSQWYQSVDSIHVGKTLILPPTNVRSNETLARYCSLAGIELDSTSEGR
jgi:hypothetical protein